MKKLLSLMAFAAVMSLTACSDDDDVIVGTDDLPSAAQTFISTYFPADKVVKVEKDTNGKQVTYDVYFASGYEADFDQAGQWTDVDAPRNLTIPDGIAPEPIATYVATNHPDNGINEISRDQNGYETELVSGLDLHFNLAGSFLYADV